MPRTRNVGQFGDTGALAREDGGVGFLDGAAEDGGDEDAGVDDCDGEDAAAGEVAEGGFGGEDAVEEEEEGEFYETHCEEPA